MRLLVEITAIVDLEEITPLDEALFVRETTLDVPRGSIDWHQVDVTRIVTPADAACDFCSLDEPVFDYPADDFAIGQIVPGVDEASSGGWLACAPCSTLIEVNDTDGLARRSIERFRAIHGAAPSEIESLLRSFHAGFFEHRRGERRPLTHERKETGSGPT